VVTHGQNETMTLRAAGLPPNTGFDLFITQVPNAPFGCRGTRATCSPATTAPHVGFWFNSPADAVKAGCPGTVTPFNGDHTAGVQAMSTRNFDDADGPLRQLVS
jgi:hypothetical protein